MALYQPDRYFARISNIDIKRDLLDCGLRFVFLDVDNTIRSRENQSIPRDVAQWMRDAKAAGVTLCLLSNNFHASVRYLGKLLDVPVVAKAMKPLPAGYAVALRKMGAHRSDSVVIGDQISTDIIGARAIGMKAYLVEPLAKYDLAHMRVMRHVEARMLGDMKPEGGVR